MLLHDRYRIDTDHKYNVKKIKDFLMKLQIKYNHLEFEQTRNAARQTAAHADILALGSLPLYQKGIYAVEMFKEMFPDKPLYVDAKITDKGEEAVRLFAQAGATYISLLAGTHFSIIQKAVDAAKKYGIHLVLDFLNTEIFGQCAVESETLGVNGMLIHRRINGNLEDLENDWQVIRGNSKLPIFIQGNINVSNIQQVVQLKPSCIVIGSAITDATNPEEAVLDLKKIISYA